MRAHEFMTPGVLYIRSLRRSRALFYLCAAGADSTVRIIENCVENCFHAVSRGQQLEYAEGSEFTTGFGDKGTILPASDSDISEMFSLWTKDRSWLCDGWSIDVFLSELHSRPGITQESIDRLTRIAQPFLEGKNDA